MKIQKFKKGGKDAEYDVSYSENNQFGRLGTDDSPQQGFFKAFWDLQEIASEVAGVKVEINTIEFKHSSERDFTVKMQCTAATSQGDFMKIHLPEIGYAKESGLDPLTREFRWTIIPVGVGHNIHEILDRLEAELIKFVRDGSGQLMLDFDKPEGNVREFPQQTAQN